MTTSILTIGHDKAQKGEGNQKLVHVVVVCLLVGLLVPRGSVADLNVWWSVFPILLYVCIDRSIRRLPPPECGRPPSPLILKDVLPPCLSAPRTL